MKFLSTRGGVSPTEAGPALLAGLAPDGGLFFPESVPPLAADWLENARSHRSLPRLAADVVRPYFADVCDVDELAASALDFEIPLVEVVPGRFVLELFHGPTLAFKDVGARFLARLLGAIGTAASGGAAGVEDGTADPLTILVATSGDTGGAVAQAFHGVAGTRVVVLYPDGQVSPLQERQFATLGENVTAVAVDGAFDDCQRLAKEAFADDALRREVRLTSANSISLGRLIPQAIYYFWARAQLPAASPSPVFCTPSGNFGNLAAGLVAQRMGLGAAGFVAATNANDVVPEYLRSGVFAPRPSVRTISNAMDVGNPSNLERIEHLYARDLAAFRADVRGSAHDDDATRAAIAHVMARHGYLLDPHTAVGWLALDALEAGAFGEDPGAPQVLLSTAHPAKFSEEIEPVLGRPVEIPARLAAGRDRELLRTEMAPEFAALRALLTA